jgi:hypothetical protein
VPKLSLDLVLMSFSNTALQDACFLLSARREIKGVNAPVNGTMVRTVRVMLEQFRLVGSGLVNGKTDSTADSDSVISVNHRNRVRDRKHRFPLFLSVLELVTAGSDTAARTLILRHKLRVRGAEFESAVTNSVPAVTVSYTYQNALL